MRGQASLELLITVGIVIAFTIPVLFLLLSVTSVGYEDTTKAQAEASSRTLADTMNTVYAQGDGAKRLILINVPATTERLSAEEYEVIVQIKTSGGKFEAVHPTIAKIEGYQYIEGRTGLIILIVENDGGEVKFYEPL